jgi:hypothetical protein
MNRRISQASDPLGLGTLAVEIHFIDLSRYDRVARTASCMIWT